MKDLPLDRDEQAFADTLGLPQDEPARIRAERLRRELIPPYRPLASGKRR